MCQAQLEIAHVFYLNFTTPPVDDIIVSLFRHGKCWFLNVKDLLSVLQVDMEWSCGLAVS